MSRVTSPVPGETIKGEFRARAIAGTRVVLIALDCAETYRHELLGYCFTEQYEVFRDHSRISFEAY